jgi:hypothetical protein
VWLAIALVKDHNPAGWPDLSARIGWIQRVPPGVGYQQVADRNATVAEAAWTSYRHGIIRLDRQPSGQESNCGRQSARGDRRASMDRGRAFATGCGAVVGLIVTIVILLMVFDHIKL